MLSANQIVHIRRILHDAEAQVYFDAPTHHDIDKALSILAKGLPKDLCQSIFHRHHIRKWINFWVTAKHHDVQGLVTSDALLAVFHQITRYCNRQSKALDHDSKINIQRPVSD